MKLLTILALSLFSQLASAADTITVSGRLLDPSNNPVVAANVNFKVYVYDPTAGACLLYAEDAGNLDLSASNGNFELKVGAGTTLGTPRTLKQALDNRSAFSGLTCSSGTTYTPGSISDGRRMKIVFDDGSPHTLSAIDITSVPWALHSSSVGGFSAGSLLRVEDAGIVGAAAPLTTANFSELTSLIAGVSTQYAKANTAMGGDLSGTLGAPSVIKLQGRPVSSSTPVTNDILTWNGTNWAPSAASAAPVSSVAGRTGTVALTAADISGLGAAALQNVGTTAGTVAAGDDVRFGTATSFSGSLSGDVTGTQSTTTVSSVGGSTAANIHSAELLANSATSSNTVSTVVRRDATGDFSAHAAQLESLNLKDSGVKTLTLKTPAGLTNSYSLVWPSDKGSNNQVLTTDAFGNLSWTTPAAGGAPSGAAGGDLGNNYPNPMVTGIKGAAITYTSLTTGDVLKYNGTAWTNTGLSTANLSDSSDLLKVSNMPANCAAGSSLTFSSPSGAWVCTTIPTATTSSSGLVTLAVNSGTAAGTAVQATDTRLSNSRAPNGAAGSDLSGNYPDPTVAKINGISLSYIALTSGDYLRYDGVNWVNAPLPAGATYWSAATGGIRYNGGNVGIGTSTPTAKLHIGGTPGTDGIKFPDGTTQMYAAFTQTMNYTAAGTPTWIVPTNVTRVKVTIIGGGGGGGGGGALAGCGGGGGAGAVVEGYMTVTPGAAMPVVVGSGGPGGSSSGNGNNGNASSFNGWSAYGGSYGSGSGSGPASGGGGGNYNAAGASLAVSGQDGTKGYCNAGSPPYISGVGGSTYKHWGVAGSAITTGVTSGLAGIMGIGYGSGGGGGVYTAAGGDGKNGAVIIEY